ncbi:hypothetical protein Vadar_008332 [Vaccinium darrowii]|uniref:Uncharacterized protein n=1 Tax=Vaccinium darrowii TaxID=229202 RepID=A0ACB7Z2Y4_9ERIC|nr:hypothetical protein Vadar_008332 [Vaccinium darrowii]
MAQFLVQVVERFRCYNETSFCKRQSGGVVLLDIGSVLRASIFSCYKDLTKVISLISVIDDVYDASNATIEELVLFNDAIQRWEVSALNQLPDYMKLVYQKLLDTYNMFDDEMAKQGRSYRVEYAKLAMKNLVRGYLAEAKWYHEGYVPSVEEYMAVGELTSGVQALSTSSFVGMGDLVTKEAFDWVFSNPLIVQVSSAIGRLMDDVAGHEFEQERGHGASAVECYMKQYGATREEAVLEFHKRVTKSWKDINSECLCPNAVPMPLLVRVLNLARAFHVVYKDGDIYTNSGTKFKEFVTSVLVDSVPI